MNKIVFSMNRACQLDLFLSGMLWATGSVDGVSVLWKATSERYLDGYNKIKKMYPSVNWKEESGFKWDILKLIDRRRSKTVFFVDDNVWVSQWRLDKPYLTFDNDDKIVCLSLRLGTRLTKSYTCNRRMNRPKLTQYNDGVAWVSWDHRKAECDWGYPMSVDGHIFRTSDIVTAIRAIDFKNPNTFEGELAAFGTDRPKMLAYSEPKIFNLPINRVQTVCKNRVKNENEPTSAEFLNHMFLLGHRLSYKRYVNFKNTACHQEAPIVWR